MKFRLALVQVVLTISVGSVLGQTPTTGSEERVRYMKARQFFIPFAVNSERQIKEVRLFAQLNAGEWEYLSAAEPSAKGFNVFTSRDGVYGLTVQNVYQDGRVEPTREQLHPDIKIVIDTVPPKISIRQVSTADGASSIEWDIVDEHLDPKSIRLECRCDATSDWTLIGIGDTFKARDRRTWVLKPNQTFEVRIKAADLAKNESTSQVIQLAGR
jgi:hypothetical protein